MRKKSIFLWGKETLYIFFEYFQQKCTHTTYTFGFSKINDKMFSDRTFFHSLHRIRSSSFDFSTRRATGQANTTMSLLNVCDFQNELVTDNFDTTTSLTTGQLLTECRQNWLKFWVANNGCTNKMKTKAIRPESPKFTRIHLRESQYSETILAWVANTNTCIKCRQYLLEKKHIFYEKKS